MLEKLVGNTPENEETNQAILPMLSSLGYPIGYLEEVRGQGTIGLHLKLGDEKPTVYGLTCRHVVSNGRAAHESYKLSGENPQYHVQADHTGFFNCLDSLERLQTRLEGKIRPLQDKKTRWEGWYINDPTSKHKRPTENEQDQLLYNQRLASYNAKILEFVNKLEKKEERKLGHLAFHSSLEVSSRQPGYLRDWALVELDPKKFTSSPKNSVLIENEAKGSRLIRRALHDDFLSLKLDDIPVEERCILDVGKRGATTGLTFGDVSGIEAVIRHPHKDGEDEYAWEMLIVPTQDYLRFSREGDSGASIFDDRGRVIGLVTASTNDHIDGGNNGPKASEGDSKPCSGYMARRNGRHVCCTDSVGVRGYSRPHWVAAAPCLSGSVETVLNLSI